MAVELLTFSGITSPSSTHISIWGAATAQPPASGGSPSSSSEATTEQYTAMASEDAAYLSFEMSEDTYGAVELEFQLSEGAASAVTNIELYARVSASADGVEGFKLYVKNQSSSAWELLGTSTTNPYSLSGNVSSSISNYLDANRRVHLLIVSRGMCIDANNAHFVNVDYAYANVTHTSTSLLAYYYHYLTLQG